MDSEFRQVGLEALGTVIKGSKNCEIFEKYVYEWAEKDGGDKLQETYEMYIYQMAGLLLQNPKEMKQVAKDLKKGKIGWRSTIYNDVKQKLDEVDLYLEKPFEVEEGVSKCGKCGCEKVFTFPKQTRSGDESTSTFCRCTNCNNSWVQS